MPYIENRTVHDADAHVMELPDKIVEYLEKPFLEDFTAHANKSLEVPDELARTAARHRLVR